MSAKRIKILKAENSSHLKRLIKRTENRLLSKTEALEL